MIKRVSELTIVFLLLILSSCNLGVSGIPEGFAMIYGVSIYDTNYPEGVGNNLTYPDDDAKAVAELFEKKGYEVMLRTDEDATKEQLLKDVYTLKTSMQMGERFVFYFSGHGAQDSDIHNSNSTLTPTEPFWGDSDNEWIFLHGSLRVNGIESLEKAIYDDELAVIIADIPGYKKIILIDACNSGGFIGSTFNIDAVPHNFSEADLESQNTTFKKTLTLFLKLPDIEDSDVPSSQAAVMAAAGEREFSWEYGNIGHGVFTFYFLESGKYADINGDEIITLNESYHYVAESIEKKWNRLVGSDYRFCPHVSGGPVDFILFSAN